MANGIVAGTGAGNGVPHFDLTGTSIKREEELDADVYIGPKHELISAGIISADMWPTEGKNVAAWRDGKSVHGNCKKDESYRSIRLYWESPRVWVGIPLEVRKERTLNRKATIQREREAKHLAELKKEADAARQNLANMITTEEAYRRYLIQWVRRSISVVVEKFATLKSEWHGYQLDPDSADDILMSVDAVVDAFMRAGVKFDAEWHRVITEGYEKKIRAVDPAFYAQLDRLTAPNPALLVGDEK